MVKVIKVAVLLLVVITLAAGPAASLLSGCKSAEYPVNFRGAIVLVAEGVRSADLVCANLAIERQDKPLAQVCAEGYHVAKLALESAELALDAGKEKSAACSLETAVAALKKMFTAIELAGGKVPSEVFSGLLEASAVVGLCHA